MKVEWKEFEKEEDDWIEPIEEWLECVRFGGFIDYDGFGQLGTKDKKTQYYVWPSFTYPEKERIKYMCKNIDGDKIEIDDNFLKENNITHVHWYNR